MFKLKFCATFAVLTCLGFSSTVAADEIREAPYGFSCSQKNVDGESLQTRLLHVAEARRNIQLISRSLTLVQAREFRGSCVKRINGYLGATLFRTNDYPLFYPRNIAQARLPPSKWQRPRDRSDQKGNPYFQKNAPHPTNIRGTFRGATPVVRGSHYVGIWSDSGLDKVYSYEISNQLPSKKYSLLLQSRYRLLSVGVLAYPGKRISILQKNNDYLIGYDLDWK